MANTASEAWRDREAAWRRFGRWTPPPSARERATRLSWLDDALRLATESGTLPDRPIDSASIRAHRHRIRQALAKIRD